MIPKVGRKYWVKQGEYIHFTRCVALGVHKTDAIYQALNKGTTWVHYRLDNTCIVAECQPCWLVRLVEWLFGPEVVDFSPSPQLKMEPPTET